MMRTSALLVAAGFAALATLPFQPVFADDASLARVIAGSENESKAAWEKRLPELVDAFAKDPESPFALAALQRILSLVDECRGREVVEQKLDPILLRGIRDGEIDEMVRDVLAKRANERGEWDRARAYESDRGYLRTFAAVGPMAWPDDAVVHRRYGPEDVVLDPKATWEGTRRRVGWTRLPVNPDSAWVDPWTRLRDGGSGIWYAVARVKAAGARPVALKIACSASFKVLVNGREVVVADRERDALPWTVFADARLVDGWNRILVKVVGRSSFAVKVCDPATGLPVEGLEEGDPLEAGACADAGPAAEPRTYRTPTERAIAAALGDAANDAARVAVAADLASGDRRTWEAYKLHEKAAAAVGTGGGPLPANVHASRGHFLADFQPFPPVQRKLLAKKEFEAAAQAFPGHTSAAVRAAEYENEDDHPDRAVKALRAQLALSESYNAWMSLARIAKARGWDAEAVDAAKRAQALQPLAVGAMSFLDEFDARLGDWAAVETRAKAMLEADRGNRAAAQSLIGRLRAVGRHADALKMLEELAARWPHELGWKRQVADTLASLDRLDEAIAMWTALQTNFPVDESLPRRIGEVKETRGDKAGALDAYRASLAIEPFQPNLWRVVTRLEGKEEDFAAGWEPDVQQILAALPSTDELKKKFPKAVAVTVLDHMVTKVMPDGSSRSYIHMVYKVLDEKGVDKYGDLPNQGELITVRAILPDGTVMTPTGLGHSNYNIEGLVPGTVLDHRFVLSQRASVKGYDGGAFTFQDSEIDRNPNPVALSRLVVLSPEGMRLEPRKRNFPVDPKVETKDGWTSTVWENRDAPIFEPEKNRPPNEEIFPLVDYSIPPVFDDAAWQLFSQRADSRGSPIVDEAVAKCVKAGMSDLEKLRAIYAFVNNEITGDAGGGRGATAVLLEKAGSRELLFESMVRSAGVPYRLGRALPWNGSGQKLADQAAEHFSGRFLWLEPSGAAPLALFMMGHHVPFGLVPDAFRGSAAFLLDESGGYITRLDAGGPDVNDASSFTIELGADESSTTVKGTLHYRSPNGYGFKRALVDMSEDDRRKFAERQAAGWFANPKLEVYDLPGLAEHGKPLDVHFTATMSTYLSQQGDAYVAGLGLPETTMTADYVDKAERRFDLVINTRDDRVDEYTIDLGSAWAVKSLPQDHVAAHDIGTYSLTWRQEGNLVRVRRERHFHPVRYHVDEYKPFVAWCKSIDDAEDRKLELRKVK